MLHALKDELKGSTRLQGKTLTLLCSSLTWLMDERDRARKGKMRAVAGGDEIDGGSFLFLLKSRRIDIV